MAIGSITALLKFTIRFSNPLNRSLTGMKANSTAKNRFVIRRMDTINFGHERCFLLILPFCFSPFVFFFIFVYVLNLAKGHLLLDCTGLELPKSSVSCAIRREVYSMRARG